MRNGAFTPEWVQRRVAGLLPGVAAPSLCVALSGGVDSVVLLAALAERSTKRSKLRAVHVHHGLHPDAGKWSEHCAAVAAQLCVPLTTLRVKVSRARGESLEAVAREARYEALAGVLETGEILLTAHHADDQLETVLLQLLRGAGIAGLAAMPEVVPFARGVLVRPLLTRTRAELEEWARGRSLTWVEDESNENEQLDRNYLRRQVLPLIRARWPGAARSVGRSARHAAEAQRLLDLLALGDVERGSNGGALSVQYLRSLSPERRRNAVRYWIVRSGQVLPDTSRLEEITRTLLEARVDANPVVEWGGVRVQRHADHLHLDLKSSKELFSFSGGLRPPPPCSGEEVFGQGGLPRSRVRPFAAAESSSAEKTPATEGTPASKGAQESGALSATPASSGGRAWDWRARGKISLGASGGTLSIAPDPHGPIDLDTLPETLIVAQRRGGERLRPKKGGPSRTLKSLLQTSRTPLNERAHLPLIYANDTLIAIADRWLDASIQANASTPNRGRLRWQRT